MRKYAQILIFSFFFSINSHGAEILQGRIVFDGNETLEILQGDFFDAIIELWPKEYIGEIKLNELEGLTIINLFYIVQAKSIKISENNQDVLQIKVALILVKNFADTSLHLLELNGKKIPIFISQINPNSSEHFYPNDFFLSQKVSSLANKKSIWFYFQILLFTFLVITIFYHLKNFFKKRMIRRKQNKLKEKWHSCFVNANSRSEIESIYQKRDEWFSVIKGITPPVLDFINIVSNYQYKKNWDEKDKEEIKHYFEEIKELLFKND